MAAVENSDGNVTELIQSVKAAVMKAVAKAQGCIGMPLDLDQATLDSFMTESLFQDEGKLNKNILKCLKDLATRLLEDVVRTIKDYKGKNFVKLAEDLAVLAKDGLIAVKDCVMMETVEAALFL